ncbi:nucleotidyltransferase domain-containing protein [Nocardia panacis]|uniref:Nucleotidyltransferase domain-containing protein n=1 Tax=Nocardia panacis TaxID=2340916 RepID=A0A3A4K9C3_9NOCA|nr:nucleotidyltransferase domain-containing protein [Nocardia panacis]RJO71456.1 nucleotidyltransferase domain-containing protein [Nocardia panacis]
MIFREHERAQVRAALVDAATADDRITAVAMTGSAALGREDRWSDIDLALRLAADADEPALVADWTERMYRDLDAVDHLDVYRGDIRFRVFLCADTLQVDLAFWTTAPEFGTLPAFRLLFGDGDPHPARPAPDAGQVIGVAWLHALHARSSIARGRVWQAHHMLNGLREQVLVLACLHHGVNPVQGRGHDDLPADLLGILEPTLITELSPTGLRSALAALVSSLLTEIHHIEPERAQRLSAPLHALTA